MNKVNYLFVTFSALFITGEIFSFLNFTPPWWIRNYLNDLLCMPIVLGICLHLVRFMKNDRTIRISLFTTLSLAVFYSLYFEIFLPPFTERYTADVFDVLLYFTGALLFYFMQKPVAKAPAVHKK